MTGPARYIAAGIPAAAATVLDAHARELTALFAASQGGPSPMSFDQLMDAAARFARFVVDGGAKS